MTDQQTKSTRIPAPLYAAAGAGDLAYQQLRKLPTVVGELSGRAVAGGFELREKAVASLKTADTTATSLRDKAATADLDKLRAQAVSNAVAFAQAAQERATAVYTALVSHGERVVGSGVVQTADVVNADIEATEEPKPVTATAGEPVTATPADVAEVVEAKPRAKRTRPTTK
jgi:heparin binding hemagglutinin HbhA